MRIGIAGLGTVGAGVVRLLQDNADLIAARAGQPIKVAAVAARDRSRDRGCDLAGVEWMDAIGLATFPGLDAVVELIGGADGPALDLVTRALHAGRPVVTANKALLAVHGASLPRTAPLAFEAAVAGGIPVIKAVREGLAANRITRIAGILNGTCNYILTAMRESRRDFADVLAEAQALGYAEADPATDIDGIDAAHKLALLAALAFGHPVRFDAVHVEGIRAISAHDITFADELGYRIKLLGIARRLPDGVETRVHPCLVPISAPIARVDGVFNAVVAEGDAVGRVMLEGRGAGAGPTASAVVADLIDLARGRLTPIWGQDSPADDAVVPIGRHAGPYYLRLMVIDRPGVIADVAAILRDHGVSLESLLQHGRSPGESVPVVLVTHEVREDAMQAAAAAIGALPHVLEPPALIRIEPG
jgi:homoserine dehydrogenase